MKCSLDILCKIVHITTTMRVLTESSGIDQPFRFSTKRYDEDTGLSYYGYRFYSASLGRWMIRDPLGEAGGMNLYGFVDSVGKVPLQTNLYNFVGNDPVNYIDPEGEYAVWVVAAAVVMVGVVTWNDIIYPSIVLPLLHPKEDHGEHQPHIECEPAHPVDPRKQKPERLPNKPRVKPKTNPRIQPKTQRPVWVPVGK